MFSSSISRRFLVVLITGIIVVLAAQPHAWAAPVPGLAAQTIPTVTPASQSAPTVAVPDGFLQPGSSPQTAQDDFLLLSAFPIGCVLFIVAAVLLLLGFIFWQRRRRPPKTQ